MSPERLQGFLSAVFSPMFPDGSLNLEMIEPLVENLLNEEVGGFNVCGSTGEGPSLRREERQAVAQAYVQAVAGRKPVLVQVGHGSLREAGFLAEHAQSIGADAVAAVPPVYYKSISITVLIKCLKEISSTAPRLPLFCYHIPSLTGVEVDVLELLRAGRELFSGENLKSGKIGKYECPV
jgi:N-acetylneuraminate lyase